MYRIWFAVSVLSLAAGPLAGQSFLAVLQKADSAEKAGAHAAAAKLYEQAYGLSGFDPVGLGVAARSAARGGLKEMALRDMGRAIDQGYLEPRIMADSAFLSLRADPRWKVLEAKMQRKIAALNQPIRAELIHLADQDQQNRQDFAGLAKKLQEKTPESAAAFKAFNSADSAIQARLRQIIQQIGWPTRSKVADDGAHAAWLIVQHMPIEDQDILLPKLQAAVKAGEAQAGDGALLQDRVLVRHKKLQLYGSGLTIPQGGTAPTADPIENPGCVDVRRKSVGLEPLADYLIRYGIVFKQTATCAPPAARPK